MKPKLKPPGTKRLKPKCDILLSTSAFKFKLRRYFMGYDTMDVWFDSGSSWAGVVQARGRGATHNAACIHPIYPLYTPYIPPIYPLYTPYITPIYPLYTPHTSPIFPLHAPCIHVELDNESARLYERSH